MRASTWVTILAMTLPLVATAKSVSPPPQPLHLVGDHWTPYDPPTEFPEGATVHVVVRGDTLWDLASAYLGDPYLWPQIWERNPYILDSHWIYPGDPIVIDVAVQETEFFEAPAEDLDEEAWDRELVEEDYDIGQPFPLGSQADVYCFVRLVRDAGAFPFSIASAERQDTQDHFSEGDVVYIDGGVAEGVQAGDRFFILEKGRELLHPVSKASMGDLYHQMGQLKILCAQEHTAIAEITFACDPIAIGNVLEPFSPVPVPLVVAPEKSDRCDEPNGKLIGNVVYNRDDVIRTGTNMLVLIDLGEGDGLYPGQFATVFRDNPAAGMPRLVLGELGILTVGEGYSTAKITDTWTGIEVGTMYELK